jgi:hypothetical protein
MTALIKQERPAGDNFAGWDDTVEGAERSDSAGIIQGTLVKFSNEAKWVTRDGDEISPDLELVAVDVARVVQKWEDGKPIETIILQPNQPFPDLQEMNDKVPREDWLEGPDGHPRGPWQAQHILYLVDLNTMDRFTFATGTVGGRIAVGDLRDKLVWMRRLRGGNVFAVVTLDSVFMKTRFGGRPRPAFKIVRWAAFGENGAAALPAPEPTTVSEPTIAEDFDDAIPEFAPAKKAKPSKNGKSNTLQAG